MALSTGATRALRQALPNAAAFTEIKAILEGGASGSITLGTNEDIVFSGTTGTNDIQLTDNLADALSIAQSTNDYIVFTTTNSSEMITLGQNITIADGKNIVLDSTTGTKIGTAITQKLGFFNATPIVQRAGAAQAAVAGTAATNSSPYGYAQAQADAIVTLVNELRAALVAFGLIKGAA